MKGYNKKRNAKFMSLIEDKINNNLHITHGQASYYLELKTREYVSRIMVRNAK